jgi:lysine 2,3-aminomutase
MNTQKSIPSDQSEQPPASGGRPPWGHLSDPNWNDWRWQLSHLLSTKEDFSKILSLTPEEIQAFDAPGMFRVGATPYFASLIDPHDPDCPIRRQVIPTAAETRVSMDEITDSLGEENHSPVPGLVHRYPDRVLMLINTQCASYCRFCTRSRMVGDPHQHFSSKDYQMQIDYIAANPVVRDVLLSGGDPLILPQAVLESILQRLRNIPHVEVIRIGSRVPIFLPMRIDAELTSMLAKYHPLWMNIHINHPKEITPEVKEALARLANAGIPLGSQTVLLAGVNDCPQVMKKLFHHLVQNRVRPYYMYQCDLVPGTSHFRTPIGTGMEIMESLRGHTSGFAVPTYVIDAPQGGGKVPVSPQYLISQSDRSVVIRNYEGLITAYAQPQSSPSHNPAACPACREASLDQQAGVSSLLSGEKQSIVPDTWLSSHQHSVPLPDNLRLTVSVPKNGKNLPVKIQNSTAVRRNSPGQKKQ